MNVKTIRSERTSDGRGRAAADRDGWSDAAIRRAAQRALDWDPRVPSNVYATVDARWIMLHGLAATDAQRSAAEQAVANVAGMLGVTNAVQLAPISARR
ncbi:MAG: BON domain-containing protein [Lautropia sp.]